MDDKPLPIGVDNFEMLVTRGYYYVDKTLLIRELLEKKGAVNLFARPRRFGKTLNLSMLQYFFEDARNADGTKKDHSNLFNGLKIMHTGEKYLSHMGQYPVISLSLKSAKQPDLDLAYRMLVRQIAGEFERHQFVMQGAMSKKCRARYEELVWERADRESVSDSLKFLSECLEQYYGKKAVLLIDEYDVPLENAFFEGFYEEMVSFLRSVFESALKTNASLEFAVLTGCLRISKESIFTGMNNLEIISVLNKNYGEHFGFTEEEVEKICTDFKLEHKYEIIKEWYDGYIFGNTRIYNPWSVVRYIKDMLADDTAFPSAYWANTSSNSIVRTMLEQADSGTKEELEALIEGKSVAKPVHEDVTYEEIYRSMDYLWNFMLFTGYFRKVSERMDAQDQLWAVFEIPNKEVRYIFRTKILNWFEEKVKAKDRTRLFTALLEHDTGILEEEIAELLMETISFHDAYESFYHGFLLGILSGMHGYVVRSNRECGTGRSDLYIRPLTRRKEAFVIEFKVARRFRDMEQAAEEALIQMRDRQYVRELRDDGYEKTAQYGIAFYGKDCLVKLAEEG
ncbi:MAG: ATP-binding protein [Eubacterium sp.]|nr:ATP-binding protein [Eubacterium sp.]